MKHVLGTSTAPADRKATSRRIPYDVLTPIRTLRKELGLTPNDLAVLTALISFLPRAKSDIEATVDEKLTVVFPSNIALSERTNGLDERTIRRCIARLAEAALIRRKTSANGKRFPLRSGGVIREAFGFDLLPLLEQYPSLVLRANQAVEKQQDLQSLRAKALALRAMIAREASLDDDQTVKLAAARNMLRRSILTQSDVQKTIDEMEAILRPWRTETGPENSTKGNSDTEQSLSETYDLTATNGQNVRHIESVKKEFKDQHPLTKRASVALITSRQLPKITQDTSRMAWNDFTHVACFYPDEPKSPEGLTRTLLDIGKMLRIGQERLLRAIKTSGLGRVLLAFNYLLAKADEVQSPSRYFDKMLGV